MIESMIPFARNIARQSATMLLKRCRNVCIDTEDIIAEAFLAATETANNAMEKRHTKRRGNSGVYIQQYREELENIV